MFKYRFGTRAVIPLYRCGTEQANKLDLTKQQD
jgi:hypothetical protein